MIKIDKDIFVKILLWETSKEFMSQFIGIDYEEFNSKNFDEAKRLIGEKYDNLTNEELEKCYKDIMNMRLQEYKSNKKHYDFTSIIFKDK